MAETLDDFYLLFLNKYEDVIVLMLKSLLLGLGSSYEIEKAVSQPDVTFNYSTSLFKHFLTIVTKLFGITIRFRFSEGSDYNIGFDRSQGKIPMGGDFEILIGLDEFDNLCLHYKPEFFTIRGLDLRKLFPVQIHPHGDISEFMSRESSSMIKEPVRWEEQEKSDMLNNQSDFKGDNYLLNVDIYDPNEAYRSEIEMGNRRATSLNSEAKIDNIGGLGTDLPPVDLSQYYSNDSLDASKKQLEAHLKQVEGHVGHEHDRSTFNSLLPETLNTRRITENPTGNILINTQSVHNYIDTDEEEEDEFEKGKNNLDDADNSIIQRIVIEDIDYCEENDQIERRNDQIKSTLYSMEKPKISVTVSEHIPNPQENNQGQSKDNKDHLEEGELSLADKIRILMREQSQSSIENSNYHQSNLEDDIQKIGPESNMSLNENQYNETKAKEYNPGGFSEGKEGYPVHRFTESSLVSNLETGLQPDNKNIDDSQRYQGRQNPGQNQRGYLEDNNNASSQEQKSNPTSGYVNPLMIKSNFKKNTTSTDERGKINLKDKMQATDVRRPTATVDILEKVSQTWQIFSQKTKPSDKDNTNNIQNNETHKFDFTPIEHPQGESQEPLAPSKQIYELSESSRSRKSMLMIINDTQKLCRICAKANIISKMYYFDGSFFCGNCYVEVSKRFKKKGVHCCSGCKKPDPQKIIGIKYILQNKFIRNQGSLLFTKEKKIDGFYEFVHKYSSIPLKSADLEKVLYLASNNIITPLSTFADIKICNPCSSEFIKCSVCKFILHKNEMFRVDKCEDPYCLDCLTLIFLKKYIVKKEFTCKAKFCWKKTSLEKVMQYLLVKLDFLEKEHSKKTSIFE